MKLIIFLDEKCDKICKYFVGMHQVWYTQWKHGVNI